MAAAALHLKAGAAPLPDDSQERAFRSLGASPPRAVADVGTLADLWSKSRSLIGVSDASPVSSDGGKSGGGRVGGVEPDIRIAQAPLSSIQNQTRTSCRA